MIRSSFVKEPSDWCRVINAVLQNKEKYVVIALLLLALVLRLIVAVALPPSYLFSDEDDYVHRADSLIHTHTYGTSPGVPDAFLPPLYPVFLALVYVTLGHSMLAVRVVQTFVSAFTCLLILLIARRLYDQKVALLSLAAMAVYPVVILWSGFHLTETLSLFFTALFFLCLVRSLACPTFSNILLSGITFSLSILTRELLVLFPLLLFVSLFWTGFKLKQVVKYIVVFSLGVAVLLGPWIARNYFSLNRLVFLTERTEVRRHMVLGSDYVPPSYYRGGVESSQRQWQDVVSGVRGLHDTDASEVLNVTFMTRYPLLYLKMTCVRFQILWFHPNGLNRLPSWPLKALYVFGHLIVLGLGSLGMFLAVRQGNKAAWPLILVFPYVTLVVMLLFRPQPRYPLPFIPFLFIFAVGGLFSVLSYLGQRQPQVV